MKEVYNTPELETIVLSCDDIVTSSGGPCDETEILF